VAVEYALLAAALAVAGAGTFKIVQAVFSPYCRGIGETISQMHP